MKSKLNIPRIFLVALGLSVLSACSLDQMASGSRLRPYQGSPVFPDGNSARLPVPGTVARGELDGDDLLFRGEIEGKVADRFPFRITREDLERGKVRFEINCSPCHGRTGLGDGMVVARGFSAPPSYFSERILREKAGHFFQVMTNGYGAMASYGDQVLVKDRWRITAYIRALQLSRFLKVSDLSPAARASLDLSMLEKNAQALGPEGRPR